MSFKFDIVIFKCSGYSVRPHAALMHFDNTVYIAFISVRLKIFHLGLPLNVSQIVLITLWIVA